MTMHRLHTTRIISSALVLAIVIAAGHGAPIVNGSEVALIPTSFPSIGYFLLVASCPNGRNYLANFPSKSELDRLLESVYVCVCACVLCGPCPRHGFS